MVSIQLIVESLASGLNTQLQHLMKMPSSDETKMIIVKDLIQDFLRKSTQSNVSKEEMKERLASVYGSELLFSKEVYEWALEMIASIPDVSTTKSSPDSSEEESEVEKPLFCEDTVYHASLCCVAVNSRDSTNYKSFFEKDYPHCLEEVSMSSCRDRVDRYLIARKEKTYFIAFQSEPSFSKWLELFTSFEQGQSPLMCG
jgi:hypothetical protein